jgi:hypothetical protein
MGSNPRGASLGEFFASFDRLRKEAPIAAAFPAAAWLECSPHIATGRALKAAERQPHSWSFVQTTERPIERSQMLLRPHSESRSGRNTRTRLLAGLATALIALIVVPSASALVEKYWWGDYLFDNTTVYSSSNSWRTNRVWRPVSPHRDFSLWFDVSGAQYHWTHNDDMNPFTLHAPSNIYSQAACHNQSGTTVNPVTCQTYDYFA